MTRQRQHWTKSGHYASAWSAHIHGPVQPMAEDTPASLARWTVAGIIGGAVMLIAMFGG